MKISLRAFTIFIDKSGKVALDSGVSGLPFLLAARVAKDQVQHDRSAALAVKWAYKVAPLLEDSLMVADSYYCSKDALDFLLEEKHAFLLSVPKGRYYHIRRKLNPHIKLKNDFTYAWNKRTGVMFCQVLDANLGRKCVVTNAYGIKKRARPLRMEDSSELVEDVVIRNAPALPTFENVNERQSGYSRENPSGWSASASSSDKEGEGEGREPAWLKDIPKEQGLWRLPQEYAPAWRVLVLDNMSPLLCHTGKNGENIFPVTKTVPLKRSNKKAEEEEDSEGEGGGEGEREREKEKEPENGENESDEERTEELGDEDMEVLEEDGDSEGEGEGEGRERGSDDDSNCDNEDEEEVVRKQKKSQEDEKAKVVTLTFECTNPMCGHESHIEKFSYCGVCGSVLKLKNGELGGEGEGAKTRRKKDDFRGRLTVDYLLPWGDYDLGYHSCDRFNWHLGKMESKFVRHGGSWCAQVDEFYFNAILVNAYVLFVNKKWDQRETLGFTRGPEDYPKFLKALLRHLIKLVHEERYKQDPGSWRNDGERKRKRTEE